MYENRYECMLKGMRTNAIFDLCVRDTIRSIKAYKEWGYSQYRLDAQRRAACMHTSFYAILCAERSVEHYDNMYYYQFQIEQVVKLLFNLAMSL